MKKSETCSPILLLETIMLSSDIDVEEARYMAVTDIHREFLQLDMK